MSTRPLHQNHPELTPVAVISHVIGHDLLDGGFDLPMRDHGLRPVPCRPEELKPGARDFRAVALVGDAAAEVVPTLERLRADLDTALLPILIVLREPRPGALLGRAWADYADAVIDGEGAPLDVAAAFARLAQIDARLGRLAPLAAELPRAVRRRLTLLRTFSTRGITTLKPRRDPGAPSGHRLPPLELIAGRALDGDLAALGDSQLLRREFFERLHVCSECDDARVAFREVCAGCHSPDVTRGEVVHHYACGHVAAEREFRRGGELVCPGCARPLRHIGIDFERPVSLLSCHGCGALSAEGVTHGRCLSCGATLTAEAARDRVVCSWRLTDEGAAAARSGEWP